jgi:hypothetical protein
MVNNAPQTPASLNVGQAGTPQQQAAAQSQIMAEGLMGMIKQL